MEFEDFNHGFVVVEHVDKLLAVCPWARLVLNKVARLVIDDGILSSHCRNFDKVFCHRERAVEDFVHVLGGVELEGLAEHDWSEAS